MDRLTRALLALSAALALAALSPQSVPHATAIEARANRATLQGVVYMLQEKSGGAAVVGLQVDADTLQGVMNFSEFPDAQRRLCGAGPFIASRATSPVLLSFVSQDTDPGCGYDWEAVYTGTATLDREDTHLWGELRTVNAGRSAVKPDRLLYEVWAPDTAPPVQTYQGTFQNVTRGLAGLLSLELREGTQLVAGVIDFDNHPGEPSLCGGGAFAGQVATSIELLVAGRDPDPECGLATTFEISITPSASRDSVTGTFRVGGEVGTFRAQRAPLVAAPAATSAPEATSTPARPSGIPLALNENPFAQSLAAATPALILLFLGLMALLLLVFLVRLAAGLLRRTLGRAKQRPAKQPRSPVSASAERQPEPSSARQGGSLPYTRITTLLTLAERAFFEVLRQAAPPDLIVFPQVRLANLVETTERRPKQRQYDFYRIQAKCVDFVLCDALTYAPRLVVELDDSSHQLQQRRERDAFVDAVLAAVGLPILHVPWQPAYRTADLAALIGQKLGRPVVPATAAPPVFTPPLVMPTARHTPVAPTPVAPTSVAPAPVVPRPQPTPVAPRPRLAEPLPAPAQPPARPTFATPIAGATPTPREMTWACGQCHREVRRDATRCPHCSALLLP